MTPAFTGRVECRAARPPYSAVAAALWGNAGDVDASGDLPAHDEAAWTQLDLRRRSTGEWVSIRTLTAEPLVLEVSASAPRLLGDASFFLAMECHGRTL